MLKGNDRVIRFEEHASVCVFSVHAHAEGQVYVDEKQLNLTNIHTDKCTKVQSELIQATAGLEGSP